MKLIGIVFVVGLIETIIAERNNVCPTFKDYYTIKNNPKCWYNFAADLRLQDIIELHGYTFEEHEVTTRDGYILTMLRIPNTNHPNPKSNPVFIQHGFLADAASFFVIGNKSLAFVLADAGYDVWLGNFRGTSRSEKHVKLTVKDKKYWNYTIDEMALIDIPAVLNRIRERTGGRHKILYIGHSLGAGVAMMYGSSVPKEAKENVELFLFMAPTYKLRNTISPYRILFLLFDPIWKFINKHDLEKLLSQGSVQRALVKMICYKNPKILKFCRALLNILFGGPSTETSFDSFLVLSNLLPGGISVKIFHHMADLIRGNFRKYDYGFRNNKVYGQPTPPDYDIKNILVPVYVMYSANDWATSKDDSINLYNTLPKQIRYGLYEIESFNHLDFLTARNAKELVYDKILKVFDKINNES